MTHSPLTIPQVNWTEQWELFCPYFQEGICKIPLNNFIDKKTEELLLNPGPGFGDLSHPTTQMMMDLIGLYSKEKTIIDLGCGSGILGLSALKMGAKRIYGLDIEIEALEHSKKNALLNNLQKKLFLSKTLPKKLPITPEILFLNMTFYEQKEAIKSLPMHPALWITSGILQEQKEEYLNYIHSLNKTLQSTYEKEGWLSFIFI